MSKFLKINLSALALFGISYLLTLAGFPYLQAVFGWLLLFLPGINIAWLLEALTGQKYGKTKLLIWVLALSPITFSAVVYFSIALSGWKINPNLITLATICSVIATFLGAWILIKLKKAAITDIAPKSADKAIYWTIGIAVIFLSIHFLLYRFIPEFDSYLYLTKIQNVLNDNGSLANASRPLFYTFSLGLYYITKIPLYWLFKIALPLLTALMIVPFYQKAKELKSGFMMRILISLFPLAIPVVALEILYPRPQSIFILLFVTVLYLLVDIFRRPSKLKYLFEIAALFVMALLGLKIHDFFIFLAFFVLVSIFVFLWPYFKKQKLLSTLGIAYVVFGAWPWLQSSGFLIQIQSFLAPFIKAVLHPSFNWWFISSYINTDGNQMGWPGWSSIFYYAYNIGILTPLAIVWWFWKGKKNSNKIDNKGYFPFWLALISFFAISEIFPRIGVAYLPDRAWLFMTLALAMLAVGLLKNLDVSKKWFAFGVIALYLASFCITWYLTYSKQGWITPNEYAAAVYLKNNTEKNALIISQHSNSPMVNFFGERLFTQPDTSFFMENNKQKDLAFIKDLPEIISDKGKYARWSNDLKNKINKDLASYFKSEDRRSRQIIMDDFLTKKDQYEKFADILSEIKTDNLDQIRPVYIVYSTQKFKGLYGIRKWWRDSNAYGADLSKFDDKSLYQKIYDKKGVVIWKFIGN